MNASSGQFNLRDGELQENSSDVLDGAVPRRVLVSKPKGEEAAGLAQSHGTHSHDSSHWNAGEHHLAAPVVARLPSDDGDNYDGVDLSPSARRLLEVSEDPLVAKKRIEKRISTRNATRYNKESGPNQQKKEGIGADIFKPWDDKPDVTLSVNKSVQ